MSEIAARAEVARHAEVLDDHEVAIGELRSELSTHRAEFQTHAGKAEGRHEAVMAALGDLRERQDRSVASYLWDLGADPVTLPGIGAVKVRTIAALAAILVATLVALGISGDDVWSVVATRAGVDRPPLPAPSTDSPAPQP